MYVFFNFCSTKSYGSHKHGRVDQEESHKGSVESLEQEEKRDPSKEDGEEVEEEDIVVVGGDGEDLLSEGVADCLPERCYKHFPALAGDDDTPFWQGWANLRLKTLQLIENKYFETAVITMILLSSLALVNLFLQFI